MSTSCVIVTMPSVYEGLVIRPQNVLGYEFGTCIVLYGIDIDIYV